MRARNFVTSTVPAAGSLLAARFAAIRDQFEVTVAFPAAVDATARFAAARGPVPEPARDLRDLPFVTLDPPGAKDLDQALCLQRTGSGFRLRYAIADLPSFVEPMDPIDREARERGVTIYCPDVRVPLHPPVLSEDAASLLPGVDRPANVWDIELDADGEPTRVGLERAWVRTHARYDYATVQRTLDVGQGAEWMMLLRDVGLLRMRAESARGGASLPVPEQEVVTDGNSWATTLRATPPVEEWNAHLSLLTGMCAARMMLDAGVGILRTMPAPDDRELRRFKAQSLALGAPWPDSTSYGAFLRTLRTDDPRHLALLYDAAGLFRGAGYATFDGATPAQTTHAALAAPYTHVTAPLRRLVDRFALAICLALSRDVAIPQWVRDALPDLPGAMARADRRAGAVERACRDAVEAAVLSSHVGQTLSAVVVDQTDKGAPIVQITEPAIVARVSGRAELGAAVAVRVVSSDISVGAALLEIVE